VQNETNDPLIGQQLDEYRLEALLGQGGMARVYRGQDVRLRRYVAVKVIDAPFRAESEYTSRFEREAQAIAQLEHPHIVRLYRYGEVNNMLYMAMQFIEGVDLQTMLAGYEEKGELMAPDDVRRIIREVCLALDYAHSKGVIHRDMKPANVMIDASGQAFIADFGLALMTEFGTQGEIFGTPQYIAPEQAISSAGAVPQSDLYAVGVMLYRMFTGVLPFTATDPLEVAMWHVTESPPLPRDKRPSITPELDAFILKTLFKEPKDRYPTGAALADALDAALASSGPTLAATAVPTLSIMERVSLSRDTLPPLPAAVTPVQTPPPPTVPDIAVPDETRVDAPTAVPRNWLIGGGVVLLVLLALWLGFNGFGNKDDVEPTAALSVGAIEVTEVAGAAPGEAATVSENNLPPTEAAAATLVPVSNEEATPTTAAVNADEPTAVATPIAAANQSGQIWLPFVAQAPDNQTAAVPTQPPAPTATPVPANTPTAVPPTPSNFQLFLVKEGKTLFVVNQSDQSFPLADLHLVMDGRNGETMSAWGRDTLGAHLCLRLDKDNKASEHPLPDGCNSIVGQPIEFEWKDDFIVLFEGLPVADCDIKRDDCTVEISGN
jgi:serine/threonine protein kinase